MTHQYAYLRHSLTQEKLPKVLAHLSFSQEKLLSEWGGVVPEIAARNHLAKVTPLIEKVFQQASIELSEVDQIGVTTHQDYSATPYWLKCSKNYFFIKKNTHKPRKPPLCSP